jgi:hypothetical protein
MKPRNFFRLALLFPYILWVILLLVNLIFSSLKSAEAWDMAILPVTFYVIGIIVWFFPYTILAIGLWIGSRNKSVKTLYRLALTAPFMLFALMLLEVVIVYQPVNNMAELMEEIPSQAALLGGFSLVFGYLCVGIALGIFRFLQAKKLILEEAPSLP